MERGEGRKSERFLSFMKHFVRYTVAVCIFLLSSVCYTYAAQANEIEPIEEEQAFIDISVQEENHEATETIDSVETIVNEEPSLSEKILETANKLKGVKYQYAGNSPSTGFDCSGFTTYVFGEHGISLPRSSSDMYAQGKEVKRTELAPGDLVFFNTSGNKISHVGIYVGDNQFIHSSTSDGVIITDLNDPYYWSKRYVGAKRIL